MATQRKKRKLAALNKLTKKIVRSILGVTWHKTQMYPDHKRTTILKCLKKLRVGLQNELSQDFSRTESRILGALSRLDEFVLNPLVQGHPGTTPEPLRRRPRLCLAQTRERMKTTFRAILILKRASLRVRITRSSGPDDDCGSSPWLFLVCCSVVN